MNFKRLLLNFMKFSCYGIMLQVFFVGLLMAYNGNAQQKQQSVKEVFVNLNLKEVSLLQVFRVIERKTDFVFNYDDRVLQSNQATVNLNGQRTVADVLLYLSEVADVKFKQVNNNINVERLRGKSDKSEKLQIILQTRTVTGKVTSMEDNEGLPGVNVVEKGTTNGTVTDLNGEYSLTVSEGATLVFSSVGYTSEEVELGGRSVIDLTMVQDIQQLSELVVVGYGTQRKEDITGSTVSLDAEELRDIPAISFEQSMQGKVAGVQISQANAAPGGGMSIRVRGSNSITGNSEPLYVIDGVPIINSTSASTPGGFGGEGGNRNDQNPLSSLNPNDIASIEILKDASATAVYGSRGANGVVIITTKKGEVGKPKVNVDYYWGVQSRENTSFESMTAEQSGIAYFEEYENAGDNPVLSQAEINQLAADGGYNYFENIFRSPSEASVQNAQLSLSGASQEGTSYYLSAGYYSQDGLIKNTGFDRYSIRLNLEKNFNKLTVGNNITFSRTNSQIMPTDGLSGITSFALTADPLTPVRDEDGNFNFESIEGGPFDNPIALLEESDDNIVSDRLIGSVFAGYEFMPGFTFRSTLGFDLDNRNRSTYFSSQSGRRYGSTNDPGLAGSSTIKTTQIVTTNTLNYQRVFAEVHNLNITGVFEAQTFERQSTRMQNRGFPSDALGADGIAGGQQEGGPNISANRNQWQIASFVGRINYAYDDRYLVTATIRRDGSSKFGANNRWGNFPSVAVGWKVHNETFMTGNFLSRFKIRASYGITGNQEIGVLNSVARYNPGGGQVFGGIIRPTVWVRNFSNPNLRWEETSQFNIGFDAAILNDRIGFTFDYYNKQTTDLLLAVDLPVSSGFVASPVFNIGAVENKGIEITLNANVINTGDFTFDLQGNFSRNRNQVLELDQEFRFGPQISVANKRHGNLIRPGDPIGVFYGYQTDGIYASEAEINEDDITASIWDREPGLPRYVDVNGDGEITNADQTVIGDPNPDFTYGFNTNFAYKGLSLDIVFQGVQGADVMWNTFDRGVQWSERFENRWTPDNTNAEYIKYDNGANLVSNFDYDDRSIFDASFFRVRNVTLAYVLPNTVLPANVFQSLRVYASGTNLLTATQYPGLNPEVNSFGQNASNLGIDVGAYPLARTFTIGLNATF